MSRFIEVTKRYKNIRLLISVDKIISVFASSDGKASIRLCFPIEDLDCEESYEYIKSLLIGTTEDGAV